MSVVIRKKKHHHHVVFYTCLVFAVVGVVSGWSLTVGKSLVGAVSGMRAEWDGARGVVSDLSGKADSAVRNPVSEADAAIKRTLQSREAIDAITKIMKERIGTQQK